MFDLDLSLSLRQSLSQDVSPVLMKTFGLFGLVSFPLLYILGASLLNENPIALLLRSIGFLFCFFLATIDYWPHKIKSYQKYYWFIAITYCLPFFATYMFIANEGSVAWQVKITVSMFWLVLVTNWLQSLVILFIGTSLAILAFVVISGKIYLNMDGGILGHFLNYAWVIVIASVFARRKEIIQQVKQNSLKMQAGAIAHEMRTPLSAINYIARGLDKKLPILIKNQRTTQEKDHTIPFINERNLDSLSMIPDELSDITKSSLTVIDMLLMNLQEKIPESILENRAISTCIKNAVHDYGPTRKEKNVIFVDIVDDFTVRSNPNILKHVFFNLLKNSLHYINGVQGGNIVIRTRGGDGFNTVHFKDTGKGIPEKILPYIFDQFYSRTEYGTGLGLAFCKMVMKNLGGDITCVSIEGSFTEFTLTFPVVIDEI